MDTPILHIKLDNEGTPRTINGHVKVKMIARQHLEAGLSISEVAEHYGISLSDVYSALSYYHDNKAQMDVDREEIEALLEHVGVSNDDLKKKVLKRLADNENSDMA